MKMIEPNSKIRHIAKAVTWRVIASGTTFALAFFFFQDHPDAGQKATYVALIEAFLKIIFYYYHERFWYMFKTMDAHKRHLVKSVTWRAIASLTTFMVALIVFKEDPEVTQKATAIAFLEIFIKMLIYYIHEEMWYRSDFGLNDEERKSKKEARKV